MRLPSGPSRLTYRPVLPHAESVAISPSDRLNLSQFALHGGALDVARRIFPDASTPWIDLSTGINPSAYPVGTVPAEAWERLPEAGDLSRLEAVATRCYGCPDHGELVAAPGTQAIIQRLPALLGGRDVRLLGRTYGEFSRVFSAAGAGVRTCERPEALAGADVAIVVNPNNPDGRLVDRAALADLAGRVGALVVDEAFMDAFGVAPSVIPILPEDRAIVLRSFGKFYGLAGLRLGFGVATPDLAAGLRMALGPWAVSGPALAIGSRALADQAWQAASRIELADAAARLDALLVRSGFGITGGTPLFRLAHHAMAPAWFETLAQAGILTRPFARAPTWLRFGLPGSAEAWSRLDRVLRSGCRRP